MRPRKKYCCNLRSSGPESSWCAWVLQSVLGLDLKSSAFLSMLPWTVMAVGSSAAGWLADGLMARGWSIITVRKRMQTIAFLGPAIALTVLSNPATPSSLAVACLTAALGMTSLGALLAERLQFHGLLL